jgi:hypothetical protein
MNALHPERQASMRIASSVVMISLRPVAWVASVVVFGCQPQPSSTPDAEAAATAHAEPVAPAPAAPSAEQVAQAEAEKRARDWLGLVDAGQYDASWDAAAPVFQASMSKEQWNQALQGARGSLGSLASRQLRAAEYKTSIQGAPEGKYVVVYFDSAFAQKPGAREIVTLRQQADDSWKVAGYFVQ